ncbi:hypothetical protein BDQ12DRAFT_230067 [Crucibulum laeve]|uniref:Uncharacterized protein n=1 Tax=Crucibulum laeve TaxID=68775 RepID=A0A5C3LVA5_9AGAR|nr:hypothetical protein BDQ12DRAFT_230067 [Crucibulum laeve]
MPKASTRPSLPTSSSDFALPPSSSSPVASTSSLTLDDPSFLLQRFRRPSLLQKAGYLSETRLHSPLASSFTLHTRRRSQNAFQLTEESESDRERMLTDSPSSSETHTPPLRVPDNSEEDLVGKLTASKPPSTPPRRMSSTNMDVQENYPSPTGINRRSVPFPLKQPRILNLLAESRPEEAEVKSEAAFQRLITSCSELPHTPRATTDRGRYPEEAGHEESQREETPSDDEQEVGEGPFAFEAPPASGTEPINIQKTRTITPAGSAAGSVNGDDLSMCMSETSSSLGASAMDIDMPLGSPSLNSMSMMATPINQWRYTPPPTSTNVVRSNKRKLEDRFDPYPSSSKRRAVSPSMLYLRDSHSAVGSSINRGNNNSRLPIAIPITIPNSTVSSAASSPTISSSYPTTYPRPISITSSPTLRATMGLSSPILRPIPRSGRRGDGEDREIEGAGEGVGGLTLG